MAWFDAALVAALVVFVVLLIRAAYVLGRNPRQQIQEHEKLAGHRFPADVAGIGFVILLWLR
jgi:hypothetical protein